MKGKKNSKVFILVFLGMLTAFGPFVTDMYLPTLPAMSEYFHTTSSMVQLGSYGKYDWTCCWTVAFRTIKR